MNETLFPEVNFAIFTDNSSAATIVPYPREYSPHREELHGNTSIQQIAVGLSQHFEDAEAATGVVLWKKMFLEISQNS